MRVIGLLVLLVLCPLEASAQDEPSEVDTATAQSHYQTGQLYYSRADYESAAREFELAYGRDPRPQLLMNISLAQERALDFDAAINAVDRYLENHPEGELAPEMRERRTNLERLRERMGGQRGSESEANSEGDSGAARPDTSEEPRSERGADPERGDGTDEGNGLMLPGVILVGAGVAAVALGALFQSFAGSAADDFNGLCPTSVVANDRCYLSDPDEAAAAQSSLDSYNLNSGIALTSFIVGGAALGAGLLLIILDDGGEDADALALIGGPGDVGLGVRGAF